MVGHTADARNRCVDGARSAHERCVATRHQTGHETNQRWHCAWSGSGLSIDVTNDGAALRGERDGPIDVRSRRLASGRRGTASLLDASAEGDEGGAAEGFTF